MASIKEGDKLYLVTRSDLSPGQRAVQACHALREFVAKHPEIDAEWYRNSNYIALLEVPDEETLLDLMDHAYYNDVRYVWFNEPDLESEFSPMGQFTACVFEPNKKAKELCKSLPLALK